MNRFSVNNKKRQKQPATWFIQHPEGGYVALPNGRSTRIRHERTEGQSEFVNRKGFVARPEKL